MINLYTDIYIYFKNQKEIYFEKSKQFLGYFKTFMIGQRTV